MMWVMSKQKQIPEWFTNQATQIEVDLASQSTVKLPRDVRPEISVILSHSRECIAYDVRFKRHQEEEESLPELINSKHSAELTVTGKGLLIIPELTSYDHEHDDEVIPEQFLDHGGLEKKNSNAMDAYDLAGSFMKVGRKYNRWVSRWYRLHNRVMYIYESKG